LKTGFEVEEVEVLDDDAFPRTDFGIATTLPQMSVKRKPPHGLQWLPFISGRFSHRRYFP
jgi:hypothetical protein